MKISSKLLAINGSRDNRKLFKNAVSLYMLQGISYIFPLITIPYLVRILGTDTFGLLSFAGSLLAYFQMIVDYGFNLSATRGISIHRNDQEWISNHFFSVLAAKMILVIGCAAFLTSLVYFVPRFHPDMRLYFWLYLGVAGSIFFPTWFFQGMEQMGYITIFNLISKIVITSLYFVVIKKPADYLWFAYLNSVGTCVIGAVGLVVAVRSFKIKFTIPSSASCRKCLKEGFQIFVSQISVTLFTNTNTFILGLFSNNQIVGKYAIAEKIVRALISMTGPVGSAIYPRTSIMFSTSQSQAIRFLKRIFMAGSAVFGILCFCLFIFSNSIVLAVTGEKSDEIAFLIRIMSFLPLTIFWDNMYGTQIMLNTNMQRQFMRIITAGGLLSVCLLISLVPVFDATGSALSFVVSQLTILICMIVAVRKARIRLVF
jgi:polysaccharide transporter, PST family